ncbi:MAG: DUF1559 domain-containing protein [Planctomycetes bacterium]|nr:DUF1559 domain-containing protein [Planctomycetota bacterium]
MTRWQTRIGWLAVLAAIGGAVFLLPPGNAQQENARARKAPESRLPANPVLYVGWDGLDAHREAWEQTAAYDALYKSGLMDVLGKAITGFLDQAGERGDFPGDLVVALYKMALNKGVSLAVDVRPRPQGPPAPLAVLVLHGASELSVTLGRYITRAAGDDLKFIVGNVQGRSVTYAQLPQTPGYQVGWWTDGEHLVVVAGADAVNTVLAISGGERPNITTSQLWKTHRGGEADFEVASVAWLDFARVRDLVENIPLPGGGRNDANAEQVTVGQLIEALGVDGLETAVVRSGYKDRALWSETLVKTKGLRRGLLALVDQPTMTLDDLPPLPAETSGFAACSVEWPQVYDTLVATLKEVARLGGPDAEEAVDGALFVGAVLKAELLEPLGNVACLYGDGGQMFFGLAGALVFEVEDARKLRRTLKDLIGSQAEREGPANFRMLVSEKHGRELVTLQFGRGAFNPAYIVDDKWLAIGLFPQAVEAFVLRVDDKLPKWTPSAGYQEALDELPKEFVSISASDPRHTVQALMGMAPIAYPMLVQALPRGSGIEQLPFTPADLPPAELVARPLFPNVAVGTVAGDELRTTARTSLPAIPLLGGGGGGSSIATAATLTALLLPAVQQAREAARRAQSKNNLKQMGLALHNYHETFGHFPQGTTPEVRNLKPEERLSWQAMILPYLDQAPLYNQIEFQKAWNADENTRFTQTKLPILMNPGVGDRGRGQQPQLAPTDYVGLAGVGEDAPTLPVTDKRAGVFAYNRATRLRDIHDGTSNTAAVAEASGDFGPWAAGGKPTIRAFTKKPYIQGPDGIGGPWKGGGHFLFADGSVRFISENADPSVIEAIATIRGGEVVDIDAEPRGGRRPDAVQDAAPAAADVADPSSRGFRRPQDNR